jgi:hypothetical protein
MRRGDLDAAVAATPADRDRCADALRVGSLVVVMIGHWFMGALTADGQVTNTLVAMPALQPLTWVLQVMPVFFLVGGVAHAHTIRRLRAAGGPGRYATFIRARAVRLLRPTAAFLVVWVGIGLVAHLAGWTSGAYGPLFRTVLIIVPQLLWFVGIYLGIAALAPPMKALHDRFAGWVVVALIASVAAVDLARFAGGHESFGPLNFALVWLALHQLGFSWYDGSLTTGRGWMLLVSGSAALLACVVLGPYPVSMVGLPGEAISNMSPPTLALLCQGIALIGAAVVLREPMNRWLQRPRPWRAVLGAAPFAMTAFLWHLTALMAAILTLRVLHVDPPEAGSALWWVTRPLWFVVLGAFTAGLVAVFVRFDRGGAGAPAAATRASDVAAAVGAALTVVGILMVSLTGVDLLGNRTQQVLFLEVTPAAAFVVFLVGVAALGLRRTSTASP